MQREAKITSKGQITVPLEVRNLLGVKTGDKLLFESTDNKVQIRAVRETSEENPFAKYVGINRSGAGSTRKQIIAEHRKMRGR